MTAINILVYPHRVCLFSDTKATNADGVQYNITKFAMMPWMRVVVAVRGYVGALRVFERAISAGATGYDGAVQFLVEHFDEILAAEYTDETEALAFKHDLDVYVLGWSATGPAAHWISNYRGQVGLIQRIDGCHISPMVDREAQQRFAPDVKNGMPALMADQARQNPGVGGWMMCTEIQENMILTYPHGGLCGLSSVSSRQQPQEEIEAWAEISRLNEERKRRATGSA